MKLSVLTSAALAVLLLVSCTEPSVEDRVMTMVESVELGTVAYTVKKIVKAEESGIAKISGLFKIFGFDKVIVTSAQL